METTKISNSNNDFPKIQRIAKKIKDTSARGVQEIVDMQDLKPDLTIWSVNKLDCKLVTGAGWVGELRHRTSCFYCLEILQDPTVNSQRESYVGKEFPAGSEVRGLLKRVMQGLSL